MNLGLRGRRALVTGASRGIGRAIALALAEEGCHLVLVARDVNDLASAATELREASGAEVIVHAADLSVRAEQECLCRTFADVDILVNNAGSNPPGELDEVSSQEWRDAWELKVFGYVEITRGMYAHMKARRSGVIVNIIGVVGERMNPRYIVGSSGNSALIAFTKTLGGRSPDFNVRVLGVNPSLTDTDRAKYMLQEWSVQSGSTAEQWPNVLKKLRLPFGRMLQPHEIGDLVAFLVSPRASYISGTIVTIDGGTANR